MSKALLIASYYRSGTSALSGTLNLAGVDIFNSGEQNEHNPRGYFENPALIRRDIQVLKRLDRSWHDIRTMPADWWQSPDAGVDTQFLVTELKKRHGESALWAVKHPHLCRLLPIYEAAAQRVSGQAPGVIQIYRDPWVVAHSQLKKNGLSRAHALLLWVSHILDAERYSRHLGRATLDYEQLVKDSRGALRRIADTLEVAFPNRSTQDLRNIAQFITPNLRRSEARGRESTPALVRELVEDVWDAALGEADDQTFENLRARFEAQCGLLDELGKSGLQVMPSLGGTLATRAAGAAEEAAEEIEGSPLRPAQRTDLAERQRLEGMRDAATDPLPSFGVVVAVPAGRVEAAFSTQASLERQWQAVDAVRYVTSDPDAPDQPDWQSVSAEDLPEALGGALKAIECDYVAVVDAGDRLEPDACLRMGLFAARHERPTLVYTDEIVASVRDPWVRYKPDFDIQRLRGLHYLGGWLCCRQDFLTEHGTLDAALSGGEDLDLALRVHDAGGRIAHLPEALYARVPDSVRVPVETTLLRQHVRQALEAHAQRRGLAAQIVWHDGAVPGSVVPRHQAPAGQPVSLVLLCDTPDAEQAADLDPARLAGVLQSLPVAQLICGGHTERMAPAVRDALHRLETENPAPDQLHVVTAAREADLLRGVAERVGDEAVVFLALDAHTDDPTWLGHLQGKLAAPADNVGLVGARADYTGDDDTPRMTGPLLLGGQDSVGMLGLGHPAGDAGPGGWLLGPQAVDGVVPPCVAIRGDVLRALDLDVPLDGAALWLDLSLQVGRQGLSVVWDPSVAVRFPRVPAHVPSPSPDEAAYLRKRWGCVSRHHHPMLTLQADALSAGPAGLAPPAPADAPYALLSGTVEGAELAVEWLRAARMSGRMLAGWAPEPLATTELLRLTPDAWLRVNPAQPVTAPDAPSWRGLFSQLPASGAPLKALGAQAERVYATSPGLAELLRKRSNNRMRPTVVLPRLPARLWSEVADIERVGRSRLRVLWVDEGDPPDWITELLGIGGIDWFIVEGERRHYDGPVATRKRPNDEVGWRDLFLEAAPNLVIRPARETTWMDCQLLLRGAAAGAALLADERLHWPEALPVTALGTRFDVWRKALTRWTSDPEALAAAGRQAREALDRIGWIEDSAPETQLIADAEADFEVVSRAV